jgi:hypothetical protein
MRSAFVHVFVAVLLVLAASLPGIGAPASGLVWNGEPAAVAEYQEAWTAWRAVTNYKSKVSTTTSRGNMDLTWEWVKPNRLRISFTTPQPGAFTIIGTDRWGTSAQGCTKLPANFTAIPIGNVDTPESQADGSITITRVGTQTIDGVATNVFDEVAVSGGKQGKKRVYIVPATKTFKRWEVESDQGKANIDYLEFNTGIRIEPPC